MQLNFAGSDLNQTRGPAPLHEHDSVLAEYARQPFRRCQRHADSGHRFPPLAKAASPGNRRNVPESLGQRAHHAGVDPVCRTPPAGIAGAEYDEGIASERPGSDRAPPDPDVQTTRLIRAAGVGPSQRRRQRAHGPHGAAPRRVLTRPSAGRAAPAARYGEHKPTAAVRSRTSSSAWPSRHRKSAATARRRPGSPP